MRDKFRQIGNAVPPKLGFHVAFMAKSLIHRHISRRHWSSERIQHDSHR